jgi:hypothetical protein
VHGVCAEDDEEEPASRWILERDACARVEKQADGMEDAGRRLLKDALEGGQMTDVEFLLDSGDRIRGHKLWLMNRCKVFERMMLSGMEESRTGVIPLRECSKGAFMVLLEYLYTGRLGAKACLEQDWEELWVLQDLYGLEQMGSRLLDAVTLGNVEHAVRVGVERGIFELLERCVEALPREGVSVEEALCIMRVADQLIGMEMEQNRHMLLLRAASAVVNAMRSHRDNEKVQESGCGSLWKIAKSNCEEVAGLISRHICEAGGVAEVVKAMRAFKNNPELQSEGCTALGVLCQSDKLGDCHLAVLIAGGTMSIVEAMHQHSRSFATQYCGLFALWNITRNFACADQVIEAKATHAILHAMNHCLDNADAQCFGNQALVHLFRTKSVSKRDMCKGEVLEDDGIGVIILGMKAYVHRAGLQELGCQVLAQLTSGTSEITDDCLYYTAGSGAVDVVLDAMKSHPEISQLHHQGCHALAQLAGGSVTNRDLAVRAGGIETVVGAILKFKSDAQVRETGCKALAKFVANDARNCRRARKAGGIEAVVEGMKFQCEGRSPVDKASRVRMLRSVLRSGCLALAQLTLCDSKNRRIAGKAGAVEAVLEAMESDPNDGQLQSFGCEALGNLTVDQEENRDKAVEMGAIDLVRSSMNRHSSRGDVLRCACHALRSLK